MTTPNRDSASQIPQIFTLDEAAEVLRVKPSWLERKAAERRIPFSMLGGSYHFSMGHLWQILEKFEEMPVVSIELPTATAVVLPRKRRQAARSANPDVISLQPRAYRTQRQNKLAA